MTFKIEQFVEVEFLKAWLGNRVGDKRLLCGPLVDNLFERGIIQIVDKIKRDDNVLRD
jgi:hypothetical protein